MNVLHISPAYYPATQWGGPMFAMHGLNSALANIEDSHVQVLTTDSASPGSASRLSLKSRATDFGPHYQVHYCRRDLLDSTSIEFLYRLPQLVRWADIVHITYTYSFPTIPALLWSRFNGKPIVWSPRGALQFSKEWGAARRARLKRLWEKLCQGLLVSNLSVLHVTSQPEKEASQARIGAPAVVIPNGVDCPDHVFDRAPMQDRLRLLYLGRIAPIKAIENLLYAFAKLSKGFASLDIYGQGEPAYLEQLKALVTLLQIGDDVRFHGHVDGKQKESAFAGAHVCVVPSHHENFCNVVAEALARAVPVIVSTGAPWPEVVDKGCGFWVSNEPDSLLQAIKSAATCNLVEMGFRGRAWMQSEYSWNARAVEMRALYHLLVGASRAAHGLRP